MTEQLNPIQARICTNDEHTSPLVLSAHICPHCHLGTDPHPDAFLIEHYCCECGEGPFPASQCHVITYDEDPFMQIDEGDLITVCLPCKAQRDRERKEAGA